jgi:hypothetical protein
MAGRSGTCALLFQLHRKWSLRGEPWLSLCWDPCLRKLPLSSASPPTRTVHLFLVAGSDVIPELTAKDQPPRLSMRHSPIFDFRS